MLLRQLSKKVAKWQAARGLFLQGAPDNLGLMRNFTRLRILENTVQAPLRCISTCQEMGDQMEMDDVVGQIQNHKAPRKTFLRGTRQKSQHLNGRSRCPLKGEIQQDEANSDPEEALQIMHTHNNCKRAYDGDDSSESMSDAIDDIEEDEALRDSSDMDSDDDGATVITPDEIFRGVGKESFNKLPEKEQEKVRRQMMDKLISAALDEPEENEDGPIPEDEQHSLRVGIIGAVNSGKSSLTNFMVKMLSNCFKE